VSIYKEILAENLDKLLNLYDLDPSSPTLGYGDRLYWGWKVSDFPNATMQGGVHSLAAAVKLGLADNDPFYLKVIDNVIRALPVIQDGKGALQEAYPNEHSFCVSALVAFDVLSSIKYLDEKISVDAKRDYLEIVRPLINFITNNDEVHAIISNHLATGVAAITLWNRLTGESNQRYQELLNVIYEHQSDEGWYKEYESADPGYQTLCLYYLSSAYDDLQDEKLRESIRKSEAFLEYFIHPDGTIGGLYGSRNTEVYYPGGIVYFSKDSSTAALIAEEMKQGVDKGEHILPQHIDTGNYVPCLNSYAYAAMNESEMPNELQAKHRGIFEKDFDDAGIYIKSTDAYYCIVNYKKGGTLKVFDKSTGKIDLVDGGIFGKTKSGLSYSTQQHDSNLSFNDQEIQPSFYLIDQTAFTPTRMILLRILSATMFKSTRLGNAFKKLVVKKLMTGKNKIAGNANRKFEFLETKIVITEKIETPRNTVQIGHIGKFKAIHMASSGYYHHQDVDQPSTSKIVEFQEA